MMDLHSKLPNLPTSIFSQVSALANIHGAINLSQGFPNFGADPKLLQLVSDALKSGHNQYAPMPGLFALREQIAQKIADLYGKAYAPDSEITVTAGATQAIFTAITAFIRPQDEVIVFKPCYDAYEPTIKLNGGVVVPMALSPIDFSVDWGVFASKITPRTRMVIINSPHNPSGRVFTAADMQKLQSLLQGTNILLLSDEVYEHIVFDGKQHQSACAYPDLANRSLVCASFGKTFHVTGWKMGYIAAPKALMEEFRKVHQYTVFSVSHPMQQAIANYLKEPQHYLGLPAFFQEKRDYFLNAIKGARFKFSPTEATYFQVVDYSAISTEPDIGLTERLITVHQLAAIPLSVFNHQQKDHKQLRFCFAKTKETLDRAADIIHKI